MFCPKCGSNVPDSTKFCPTCGALLADEAQQAPATEPQPEPQYQPQQPVYQAAPADNNPAALKVSQFFWLDFLTGIPLVGFILTLVWGFGGDVNENMPRKACLAAYRHCRYRYIHHNSGGRRRTCGAYLRTILIN